MVAPLAVQMYSIREALAADFERSMHRLAAIGYMGVEPARAAYMNEGAETTLRLLKELKLSVPAIHSDLPLGDAKSRVIETAQRFGAKYIIYPAGGRATFQSLDAIYRLCDQLNEAASVAAPYNLHIAYHNHEFEAEPLHDSFGLAIMLSRLSPEVKIELDAYWLQVGGQDPAAFIAKHADRIPLIHVKDGPVMRNQPNVAVGSGKLDYKAILAASRADWLVVEFDQCASDMFDALDASFRYLTKEGFGHGR